MHNFSVVEGLLGAILDGGLRVLLGVGFIYGVGGETALDEVLQVVNGLLNIVLLVIVLSENWEAILQLGGVG